jgi:DNA polymerase III subunit epsilon
VSAHAQVVAAGNWWQSIATGFDLETTGKDVRTDRVLQYCVADTAPATDPRVFAEYLVPGIPIHPDATRVHGITDEWITYHGNPPVEGLVRLVEELARRVIAQVPIMGMNLAFDFTLLRYECLRWGIPWVEERAGRPLAPIVDIYVLDKRVDPYQRGSRKLADHPEKGPGMATKYGVSLVGAHDAVADTVAAVEVGRRIVADHPEVNTLGLYRLHAMQADWKAEQSAGLQHYFRSKKGQLDAVVDPCWPVCYDDTHIRT